ncbi:MAG: tetratricopeptide repeat protein [Brevinematales bacterium]|nr:tetratricopeptide repeat protein [Brevinematales bacterium]
MKAHLFFWFVGLPLLVWAEDTLSQKVEKLLQTSNYQQARDLVERALQKEPDISSHYILLSRIYREEGRYSNAYRVIKEAYGYFPKNPWVAKEFADVYRNLGEYRKALTLYREGLPEIEERYHTLWYYGMGVCYFELGEHDRAILFLEKSLGRKISFWSLYYLGRAYRAKGLFSRAIWAFERSELQLFLQPEWAKPLLYTEWGTTLIEFGLAIKQTNTEAARALFSFLLQDKRFSQRHVRERAEFWLKRL